MGRIFNEHTHFYSLTAPIESRDQAGVWFGGWEGSYPWTGTLNLDFYRLSGLAFGSEYGARQAVFVNTSPYAANISIPSYHFRKTWSFGNGSNPLPDFAVNPVQDWRRHPHFIPTPTVHSGGFTQTLSVPAYSMVVADMRYNCICCALRALIEKAEALQAATMVSESGMDVPSNLYWATRFAHDNFATAIRNAIAALKEYTA
ncbi:MAG: hypothetical protein FWB96_00650 [Defluviitaleaceae bacterium]|nr:hypothetical protein [Defluviitaleaceae bacterium]MCL2264168.1 hypothetical protein [Defluviitaleaceae bacterium]